MKILLAILFFLAAQATAQTSAFTYQGKLTDGSNVANGSYDLLFRLFDQPTSGTQIGSDQLKEDVSVTGGVFTVSLDFGTSPFTSATGNFLEISVRPGTSTSTPTPLSPRQAITSSPYSVQTIRAQSAALADNASALGGVPAAQFVQTDDPRLSDPRPPQAGSVNYIQNGTGVQLSSSFNISGNGTVGQMLTASSVNAGDHYSVGGERILRLSGHNLDSLHLGVGAGAANLGIANTFIGHEAGTSNTSGDDNSFVGHSAGKQNLNGDRNSIFGRLAGYQANLGDDNSFFGYRAGAATATNGFSGVGARNSFFGTNAGLTNALGTDNTLLGANAQVGTSNLQNASAIGANSMVTQTNSVVLGAIAGINGAGFNTRVGIGTTAPAFRFHVKADGQDGIKIQHTGTGAFPQLRWTDSADAFKASIGVDTSGTGSMNFFVNGADRLVLSPNGVVRTPGGIFIANPNTLVITSPNGSCWGITVSDTGTLGAFPTACP